MNINYLRIPIAFSGDLSDLNEFTGFDKSDFKEIMSRYEKPELEGITKALEWAEENPNHDFASMLPHIKHKNKDIYEYLCTFHKELRNIGL